MEALKVVKTFAKSGESFRLVRCYGNREVVGPTTRRVLVLDSSFNPPHRGHLAMIRQGVLDLDRHDGIATINTNAVLLLFSVKNADKDSVGIEEYARRLHLVGLMAEYVSSELGLSCGVALTDASLFVEKSHLVASWIGQSSDTRRSPIDNFFLLGFDTLIRFFDPKYYKGPIVEALVPFFQQSKLCVLLRNDMSSKLDVGEQKKFIQSIQNGEIGYYDKNKTLLPASWSGKLFYCEARDEWAISSSSIRRAVRDGNSVDWESKVLPSVKAYINSASLYRE